MTLRFLFVLACVIGFSAEIVLALPAFPGAEGEGTQTPGGRGGDVLLVTSLEDSGPGTLRAACEADGARMVIIRVSGVVELESPIAIRSPFITIAGQAAPGGGICLKNFGLRVAASDVVIRFLRVRPGNNGESNAPGIDIVGASRVVVDHCSVSWTTGPAIAVSRDCSDVTVQWCVIGETLFDRDVAASGRGIGLALAGDDATLSVHHNYIAHHHAGSPFVDGANNGAGPLIDFRNNVVYDWGDRCGTAAPNNARYNLVANVYKAGPSTPKDESAAILHIGSLDSVTHYADNELVGSERGTANNFFLFRMPEGFRHQQHQYMFRFDEAFDAAPVRTLPTDSALNRVMEGAGASRPARDSADARMIAQYRLKAGRVIADVAQVDGWPEYAEGEVPADADGDGMPDAWERDKGLNPEDSRDASRDADGDGYTNIEDFLNSFVPSLLNSR